MKLLELHPDAGCGCLKAVSRNHSETCSAAMLANNNQTVFISYTRADQGPALELYDWLTAHGFDVWMDVKRLKPGQNWDHEIKSALDNSSFVVLLLSNNSIGKRGYVQREVKIALDKLEEKLVDDIYVIPVMLDDLPEIPSQVRKIQAVSTKNSKYKELIAESINHQIERVGGSPKVVDNESDLSWTTKSKTEAWDGLPGYEIETELIDIQSNLYPNLRDRSIY